MATISSQVAAKIVRSCAGMCVILEMCCSPSPARYQQTSACRYAVQILIRFLFQCCAPLYCLGARADACTLSVQVQALCQLVHKDEGLQRQDVPDVLHRRHARSRHNPVQFDLDYSGRYLVTPSHADPAASGSQQPTTCGIIRIFDLWGQGAAVAGEISCPGPSISGVSLHPTAVRCIGDGQAVCKQTQSTYVQNKHCERASGSAGGREGEGVLGKAAKVS